MTQEILEYVYDYVLSLLPAGTILQIGALPVKDGLSIAISAGGIEQSYIGKDKTYTMSFVLNSKAEKQEDALEMLDIVHTALAKNSEYMDTEQFHFVDLHSLSMPTYLGRENDEKYMYGSSIQVIYYLK